MEVEQVADEAQAPGPQEGLNGDAPESEQAPQQPDDLLRQDQQELPERVAHLEKRVRDQDDEIVCLKGALAEVMRRMHQVEAASKAAQNSLLPSKPYPKSPRRAPTGQDRPKSMVSDSYSHRTPASPRSTPRGASASSVGKRWGSVSNSIDETNGHKPSRPSSALTHTKRISTSHGSLPIKALTKGDPTYNPEYHYVKIFLNGRPIPLYAPSAVNDYKIDGKAEKPSEKLQLEWVYGYRGRDTRSNLYQLCSGEVVYFTAAVVVLHSFETQSQRFYTEHNDDIKCLAVHPDGMLIATGQVCGHDKKAHVRIWSHMDLNTLHEIGFDKEVFQRGVCCVGFGKESKSRTLFAIDDANDHVLSVWQFDKDNKGRHKKIAENKSSRDPVTQCEFISNSDKELVLCGKNNMSFWTVEDGKLSKKMGIFGKTDKPSVMICFAFANNGEVISGDSTGNMYIWEAGSNTLKEVISGAHDGGIFSICVQPDDGTFLTGGKDRKIKLWGEDYSPKNEEAEIDEAYGCPRMITQGSGKMIYVGTIRNCILQGNMEMKFTQVMVEGHKAELWGCDTHPDLPQFLTCGYDKHVYLWDTQSHKSIWFDELNYSAHCCCFHPEETVVAIGMQSPKILLFNIENHDKKMIYTPGSEQIECIQFSPKIEENGETVFKLAAGSRDNNIYVYTVDKDEPTKLHKVGRNGKCSGHHSFVRHIDWDTTGKYLRSDSGDYELLYWDAETCKQETDKSAVRDLDWATNNCILTFNTIGLWQDGADGTDLNNCGMSHDRALIASADDFGKVTLYKYPSIQHTATGHEYGGHSSHVTMAKFICDDSRVITTGGNDCSIFQWKVE